MTGAATDRMTAAGLEACVAYGAAALAVLEAKDVALHVVGEGSAAAALEELVRAHDELAQLFAGGASRSVPEMALSVIVLAARVTMLVD